MVANGSQRWQLPDSLASEWMSHLEARKAVGLSRSGFDNKRRMGMFECRRLHGRVIVKRSDVDRYLNNLPVA